MSRFRLPLILEICVPIMVLPGCGGDDAARTGVSEAAVMPTGTAPVAISAGLTTFEDQWVRSKLQATDAEGDALTFSIVRAPDHSTLSLDPVTGAYELQPNANYFGTDAFEFAVSDGHGNAARAQVDVSVVPVRDPPVIDTRAMASVVAAGREAQLNFGISDPDGDAVALSVSQVGGTSVLPSLQVGEQVVRFVAPDVPAAESVELLFEAADPSGLSTRTRKVITLSPVSQSGKLFTVLGSPQSAGMHWVITGDGFTAGEQQDLLRASITLAESVAGVPELARHAKILNVHVLTAVSLDSGVTTAGASRTLRTAFDAIVGCADVERVACVNWGKVYAALLSEQAPFDEVAVILNTSVYAGSGSNEGVVVSRNAYAPAIALHEMGHTMAGLADEYIDDVAASAFVPGYREGQFPNVTTATDPARIPWRHWFADSTHLPDGPGDKGVGRFEGAFYSASGFFRPKQDSIMRSLEGAVGEVNAEAWLRAMYRAVPPISAAYPMQSVVAGPAGATIEFELVSPWPPELVAIRWFIDGLEVDQARGAYRYALHADGGPHEVRVSVEDCSGSIRAPDAREHLGGFAWTVRNEPELQAHKAQPQSPRIGGWIRMRVDPTGHNVLGLSSSGPRRVKVRQWADASDYEYALYDGGGAMVSQGRIADPRAIHGPLAPPGASETGHSVLTLQSGHYLIGVPAGVDARRLRIRRFDGSMKKTAQSEQWLDL
ncbi:MAG TPA: M64 family metallopeptidase [Steroidobacteraceae bacterium]|nr:M64 family metallopeptidase [Steroidobacteraceae bacterium]